MKFLEKNQLLRNTIFGISCVFVYGGDVNFGGFDFIPAIPFLGFILFSAYKWKRAYLALAVIVIMTCSPLYFLKKQHGYWFHPALEREFTFNQDICLTEYAHGIEHFVLASEIRSDLPCNSSNIGGAIKSEILPMGTKFKVKRVSVSNADFGESYVIHADTKMGELALYGNEFAVWMDGKKIEQGDLRRAIFYIPSLLMYWPVSPFLIPAIFKNS